MATAPAGPIYPLVKVPAVELSNYPHMQKRDAATWERFLEKNRERFVAFAYDVALGGRTVQAEGITEAEQLAWRYATGLKIDVIAFMPDVAWVIEVKPNATVSALGAALAYTFVCQRDGVLDVPILPAVVCDVMQPDVKWCCEQLGVHVEEVGA